MNLLKKKILKTWQNIEMLENNGNHSFRSLMYATYIFSHGLVTIILSILLSKEYLWQRASIAGISGIKINIIFILFLIIINTISFIVLLDLIPRYLNLVVGYSNGVLDYMLLINFYL